MQLFESGTYIVINYRQHAAALNDSEAFGFGSRTADRPCEEWVTSILLLKSQGQLDFVACVPTLNCPLSDADAYGKRTIRTPLGRRVSSNAKRVQKQSRTNKLDLTGILVS